MYNTSEKREVDAAKKCAAITVNSQYSDNDWRLLLLNIRCNETEYCLINIYSPTADHEDEQVTFYDNLERIIESNLGKKIIIGGDFNTTFADIDRYSLTAHRNNRVSNKINQLIKQYDLIDIWRVRNPDKRRYTWRKGNPLVQSRLDFYLISTDASFDIFDCDIKPSIKTDHSMLVIKLLKPSPSDRGKGLWKFNSSLLSDIDFVEYIKGMIRTLKDQYSYLSDKSLKWKIIKMDLRNAIMQYSRTQSNLRREYENQLNKKHDELYKLCEESQEKDIHEELAQVKLDLENINSIKCEGYRIRA